MPLLTWPKPFSDSDYVFELKYEGFRALARIMDGKRKLVSRNNNQFSAFAGAGEINR
jgi:ATP-dependent DNA ligase